MEVYFMIQNYEKTIDAVIHPKKDVIEVSILRTRQGDSPLTNEDIIALVRDACNEKQNTEKQYKELYIAKLLKKTKAFEAQGILYIGHHSDGRPFGPKTRLMFSGGLFPFYVRDIQHVDYIIDKKTGNFLKSPNH